MKEASQTHSLQNTHHYLEGRKGHSRGCKCLYEVKVGVHKPLNLEEMIVNDMDKYGDV